MATTNSLSVSFPGFKLKLCLTLIACVIGVTSAQLSAKFYEKSCPGALATIRKAVKQAVHNEFRMGASLLRLHFHDCFVQGCDASVLLDDTDTFTGEKNSFPNANSLRGFDVIDNIKSELENMCQDVVSCADILAVAARDAVFELGGPRWEVPLGRRDSTTASLAESNSDLPAPFFDLDGLTSAFAKKNFTVQELVTLSGGHSIGLVRCRFFRKRIYNESNIDQTFAEEKQQECPFEGGDDNLSAFDSTTPFKFDNAFYKNLLQQKGLVHSDQQLFNGVNGTNSPTKDQVVNYARNMAKFKKDFAAAMLKMSMMTPLTGSDGEIRKKCSRVNPPST
ncbi:cationic peroxidase 1-like isoform X2 [Vigna umbellata]|uniref:cationic peroxidase 1-like isoform X1 n=1 Tax=Vigna umbellata TaxID=87088 RepID=UPI001F5E91E4|nr:cationic peroxidase 1-like isoform X1 [Vigna umbellata]XP_047180074.1 cationic peroxidase 1-like isoform X2 [Vigna umbellata]